MFKLGDATLRFVAPYLLIQSIEKLLACRGAGKRGPIEKSAAKPPKIQQTFRRTVEGNTHAIQQIDDGRRSLTHGLDRRLVGKKIAAVNRVVKVLPRGIAFALEVLGSVNATLRAYGVRSFHRHDGKQINVTTGFCDLDDRRQPGEPK